MKRGVLSGIVLVFAVLLAILAVAVVKSDYLSFVRTEADLFRSCTYYDVKNPLLSDVVVSGGNLLGVSSWELKGGAVQSSGWEVWVNESFSVGDVWVVNVSCKKMSDENGTVGEVCTDLSKYVFRNDSRFVWKPLGSKLDIPKLETLSVRFCANTVPSAKKGEGWGVEIDHVPSFMGYTYPEYAWWNMSFQNKRKVNFTIGYAVPGSSTVLLNLSKTQFSGMMSNCNDLRFANSSDSGQLNHWVRKCTSSNIIVYINYTGVVAGKNSLYVYWKNSSAVSNGSSLPKAFTGLYSFHGFEGNFKDYVGNRNGTNTSGTSIVSNANCTIGQCMSTSATSWVDIGVTDTVIAEGVKWTVMVWLVHDGTDGTSWGGYYKSTANGQRFDGRVSSAPAAILAFIGQDVGLKGLNSTEATNVMDKKRFFSAFAWQGTNSSWSAAVNHSVRLGTFSGAPLADMNANIGFYLGARDLSGNNNGMTGFMDEFMIWSRALPANELKNWYNMTRAWLPVVYAAVEVPNPPNVTGTKLFDDLAVQENSLSSVVGEVNDNLTFEITAVDPDSQKHNITWTVWQTSNVSNLRQNRTINNTAFNVTVNSSAFTADKLGNYTSRISLKWFSSGTQYVKAFSYTFNITNLAPNITGIGVSSCTASSSCNISDISVQDDQCSSFSSANATVKTPAGVTVLSDVSWDFSSEDGSAQRHVCTFDVGVFTPTAAGTYTYNLSYTDGEGSVDSLSGNLAVSAASSQGGGGGGLSLVVVNAGLGVVPSRLDALFLDLPWGSGKFEKVLKATSPVSSCGFVEGSNKLSCFTSGDEVTVSFVPGNNVFSDVASGVLVVDGVSVPVLVRYVNLGWYVPTGDFGLNIPVLTHADSSSGRMNGIVVIPFVFLAGAGFWLVRRWS